MNHSVNISLSRNDPSQSVVHCRKVSIRERFIRALLGKKRALTIIVPGDSVNKLTIIEEGENENESNGAVT